MLCTNGYHIDLIDDAANLPGSGAGYPAREVEQAEDVVCVEFRFNVT